MQHLDPPALPAWIAHQLPEGLTLRRRFLALPEDDLARTVDYLIDRARERAFLSFFERSSLPWPVAREGIMQWWCEGMEDVALKNYLRSRELDQALRPDRYGFIDCPRLGDREQKAMLRVLREREAWPLAYRMGTAVILLNDAACVEGGLSRRPGFQDALDQADMLGDDCDRLGWAPDAHTAYSDKGWNQAT